MTSPNSHNHWIEGFDYVTPDGAQTFKFFSGYRCLMTFEGLGMPDIEYITQQGPHQHGETMIDFRAQKRIIQIFLREEGCSRQDYWDNRLNWLNYLRPNYQPLNQRLPGTMIVTKPDLTRWAIKCLVAEGPKFGPRSLEVWDEWGVQDTIRFVCFNPIWYNPDSICVTIGGGDIWDELVFYNPVTGPTADSIEFKNDVNNPTGEDLIFASNLITASTNVTYPGTWMSFPNFALYGPLSSPTITNVTTGESISLNYAIAAGEVVTIYLLEGNKWVDSTINGEITGIVTDQSRFSTFHLEPNPGAAGGINTLTVTGDNAIAGVTRVDMIYYINYIGI